MVLNFPFPRRLLLLSEVIKRCKAVLHKRFHQKLHKLSKTNTIPKIIFLPRVLKPLLLFLVHFCSGWLSSANFFPTKLAMILDPIFPSFSKLPPSQSSGTEPPIRNRKFRQRRPVEIPDTENFTFSVGSSKKSSLFSSRSENNPRKICSRKRNKP